MATLNDTAGANMNEASGGHKRKHDDASEGSGNVAGGSGDPVAAAISPSAAESKRQRTGDGSVLNSTALSAADQYAAAGAAVSSQEEQCELRFMLPSTVIGSVIGKGGAKVGPFARLLFDCRGFKLCSLYTLTRLPLVPPYTPVSAPPEQIHSIRNAAGVMLHVDKQAHAGAVERCVKISGSVSQVEQALSMVHEAAGDLDPTGYGAAEARMLIPSVKIGGVIGKRGATISELRTASKCDIHVSNEDYGYTDVRSRTGAYGRVRLATIKGAANDVLRAKMLVTQKLMTITASRDRMPSMNMQQMGMGYGAGAGAAAAAGAVGGVGMGGMNGMPTFDATTGMYTYGNGRFFCFAPHPWCCWRCDAMRCDAMR